jgi:Leucine-rich repeat (LRR) protein
MPNLEVISLSLNKITTMRDIVGCSKVAEIYLRKNNICDLKEISYLSSLTRLKVLWLSHNPCAEHAYYRAFVVYSIPSLVKLDNAEVTQAERDQAKTINFNKIFAEKSSLV